MKRTIATILAGAIIGIGLGMVVSAPANAEPYGGCVEAYRYASSPGAQDCRDLGWTIRPRLVVDPQGWVHVSMLPACRQEDGSGQRSACAWNFSRTEVTGNGQGRKYWVDQRDRVHYVRGWATI